MLKIYTILKQIPKKNKRWMWKKRLEIISWLNIIYWILGIYYFIMLALTSKSPIVNRVAANESDGGISGLYTYLMA